MIPKILHFIWLGNQIPSYANFSINAFKTVNPAFEVNFIHYTIKEIEDVVSLSDQELDCNSKILKKTINSIIGKDKLYNSILQHCKKSNLRFIQVLSDIYRLEILNQYGGIYLDCDCFPIKSFDEDILQKQFIVTRHLNDNFIVNDNYFIGSNNNVNNIFDKLWDIFDEKNTIRINRILQTENKWWKNINYLILKKKFIECKLKFGESFSNSNFYIDHYAINTWKNDCHGIQTPLCKFDKLLK